MIDGRTVDTDVERHLLPALEGFLDRRRFEPFSQHKEGREPKPMLSPRIAPCLLAFAQILGKIGFSIDVISAPNKENNGANLGGMSVSI